MNNPAKITAYKLLDIEREYTSSPLISAVFAAYALAIGTDTPEANSIEEVLEFAKVSSFARKAIMERLGDHWDRYQPMRTAFSKSELVDCISELVDGEHLLNGRMCPSSSSSPVVDLVARILDVKDGETVCDLGCAGGDFLRCLAVSADQETCKLQGIEINPEVAAIAEIRNLCDGLEIEIVNDTVFSPSCMDRKFDKVFFDPPLGARGIARNADVCAAIRTVFPDFPEISPLATGDWLYVARAAAALKKNGRAVVLVPPGALWDLRSEPFRRFFVSKGLIRAIIELPERMFAHTGIGLCALVLEDWTGETTMVRASELYYPNRKSNVMGKSHIDIVAACLGLSATSDSLGVDKFRRTISKTVLLENECDLTVKRFFIEPVPIKNGIPLGSLVRIKRGLSLTPSELDKLSSDEPTHIHHVSPGNIDANGIVSGETFLKELPDRYRSACVADGDILVSRISSKDGGIKVAVVSVPDGQCVLPNGNLLVLSADREKVDPHFLKVCLKADYARRFLEDHAMGAMSLAITPRDLESLPIPALSPARQREIAEASQSKTAAIVELRRQLAETTKGLSSILQDYAADCFDRPEKED